MRVDFARLHRLEQRQRAADVVVVVLAPGADTDSPTAFSAAKCTTASIGRWNTRASTSRSRTSPLTSVTRLPAIFSTRFTASGELLLKLSRQMTSKPAASSSTIVCDPMYPAPPVTSTAGDVRHSRFQIARQRLAEFDARLVERIDAEQRGQHRRLVLVQSQQAAQ